MISKVYLLFTGVLLATMGTAFGQPVITNQPQTQAVAPGSAVTFEVRARGTEPLTYRWQRDAGADFSDLADGTNAVLALTNVQPWDALDYRVVVADSGGARTSAVAHVYVMRFPSTSTLVAADDFKDGKNSGWSKMLFAGRGGFAETNRQLTVYGSWPGVKTIRPWDTLVEAVKGVNWSMADGNTIEFRADLVGCSENATNSAGMEAITEGSYLWQKGRDWIRMGKYRDGSVTLWYEKAVVRNTNVVLAFALTRANPNVIITVRIFDKERPDSVLYQHSVVDTPGVDPSISTAQLKAASGMSFETVSDTAGAPFTSGNSIGIGGWQYCDGAQPPAYFVYDNFEVRRYSPVVTRYVDVTSVNPKSPYTNWATAARVIQDAVDAANPGDEIIVANGVYASGGRAVGTNFLVNRVAVDKPLAVRSVNGPQFTAIQGNQAPGTTNGNGAIRCVYLADGASLYGFTLTNGATRASGDEDCEQGGGGVWCDWWNAGTATLSNCVLIGNSAAASGGGVRGGTLYGCTVTGNRAGWEGGGAAYSQLYDSMLSGNEAGFDGGGVVGGRLYRCSVSHNSAGRDGGGAILATLYNCSLTGNSAQAGGGASSGKLYNCTVVGNSGNRGGGGVSAFYEYGYFDCELYNCIVYFNHAPQEPNYAIDSYASNYIKFAYSCTTPVPGNSIGNIASEPLFVDYAGGNLRLQSNSPCINAGCNAYAPGATDQNGKPRIVSGTADMGADEFQGSGSEISYAWLQQYGLATDGSGDFDDADADGLNNWQEWRCNTNPTNASSALRLVSATLSNTNIVLTWQSVAGVDYFVESSANLSLSFRPLANVSGEAGTTSYSEAITSTGPLFYRVGVRP